MKAHQEHRRHWTVTVSRDRESWTATSSLTLTEEGVEGSSILEMAGGKHRSAGLSSVNGGGAGG